jgi:hypothetical protein
VIMRCRKVLICKRCRRLLSGVDLLAETDEVAPIWRRMELNRAARRCKSYACRERAGMFISWLLTGSSLLSKTAIQ